MPDTKLVVIDSIIDHACATSPEDTLGVPGLEQIEAPEPLLANLGQASVLAYDVDMIVSVVSVRPSGLSLISSEMMLAVNASERTIADFQGIFTESGWKLAEVRRVPGSKVLWPSIIAVPI